uniref:Cwf15/Cwc15 cell cycle control protein n=3 Tax=Ascarididae TaxID=6250 RepID=A0A915APQ9_PARUN
AQRDAVIAEEQERIRTENILHGNPLLNPEPADFRVKRRWDDDVVFKNCAKGLDERKKEPSFINDAIRSEFHRKFMEKYIK